MKICIISSYPPEKEGVGLYTKRLVDNFNIKGIDISVLTFNYKSIYKEKNIFQVLGASPKNIIKTYTSLTSIKPDIIHIQYATPVYRMYSVLLWSLLWIYLLGTDPKKNLEILTQKLNLKKNINF